MENAPPLLDNPSSWPELINFWKTQDITPRLDQSNRRFSLVPMDQRASTSPSPENNMSSGPSPSRQPSTTPPPSPPIWHHASACSPCQPPSEAGPAMGDEGRTGGGDELAVPSDHSGGPEQSPTTRSKPSIQRTPSFEERLKARPFLRTGSETLRYALWVASCCCALVLTTVADPPPSSDASRQWKSWSYQWSDHAGPTSLPYSERTLSKGTSSPLPTTLESGACGLTFHVTAAS